MDWENSICGDWISNDSHKFCVHFAQILMQNSKELTDLWCNRKLENDICWKYLQIETFQSAGSRYKMVALNLLRILQKFSCEMVKNWLVYGLTKFQNDILQLNISVDWGPSIHGVYKWVFDMQGNALSDRPHIEHLPLSACTWYVWWNAIPYRPRIECFWCAGYRCL